MTPKAVRSTWSTLLLLVSCAAAPRLALADGAASRLAHDGVYDRFNGDLDLGLALGAELGSAGRVAPVLRGTAHYFSIAGVYLSGRVKAGEPSAPSLFGFGVDLRPLFVPRWAKGFETGPRLFDLTLDSLSLSLGAFWTERPQRTGLSPFGEASLRGFEAGVGFGVPLFGNAAGPWFEARGFLRYPDAAPREEAMLLALSWHGFVTTPFSKTSGL